DLEAGDAVQRGNLDLAAERSHGDADRHFAMQVVMVALEHAVFLEMHLHIQVAVGAAVHTGLAFAGAADAIAFVDAGGNLHRQGLVRLLAARAVAVGAGRGNELAGAVALGAGLLDREEALLHAHLAMTVTGRAGLDLGALLGAAAVAGCAFLHGRDADLGLGAACGFLERDLEVVAQVGAAVDIAASAATAGATAEDVAEDRSEEHTSELQSR